MDHDPLTPLFSPLTTLRGVGPTVGALIAKVAGGERVIDLLFHLPESYVDRRQRPTIARSQPGEIVTLAVEVVRIEPPANARQPWRVVVTDGTGFAELVFFRFNREKQMPVGAKLLVSGKVDCSAAAASSRIPTMSCQPISRSRCRRSSRSGH